MDYVGQRMVEGKPPFTSLELTSTEANKPAAEVQSIFTPINLILFALLLYILYITFKPPPAVEVPKAAPPVVFKTFTPPELLPFNGEGDKPVYLAVRGQVFDVTSGRNFYGPGGPYANFAGRDASRGLASSSFDVEMLTENLHGPLDPLEDLDDEKKETLQGWEDRFKEKYLVVGRLVAVGEK